MNSLSSLNEISLYRYGHTDSHLILDTNVLLLFLIGTYDPNYIESCCLMKDNGANYTKEHFDLIKKILGCFLFKVTITPQILSEVYSLSKKIDSPRFQNYFIKLIEQLKKFEEHHIKLEVLLSNVGLVNFGFTDLSLVETAKQKQYVILTDEWRLYNNYSTSVPIIKFGIVATKEIYKVIGNQ
jgi:hypothetical protein